MDDTTDNECVDKADKSDGEGSDPSLSQATLRNAASVGGEHTYLGFSALKFEVALINHFSKWIQVVRLVARMQ